MKNKFKLIFTSVRDKIPHGASVSGAIQGVFGDKLPARFKTEMAFYAEGKPLDADMAIYKTHACIFVHGNSDTELGWSVKPPQLNFGDQLLLDYGVAPLYIRYNSGLSVSDNGESLAQLMQKFYLRHKSCKLTLIGHSMGGLVIHSAVYHAKAQSLAWIKKVKQIFLLGTPHAGAPLAKIAEKGEQILQFIPNPFTLMAASVIGMRSRGLKDLSRGQTGLPAEGKILLPGVKYVFIAGGVQKKAKGILNRLVGDGMVRGASAQQGQKEETNWLKRAVPWLTKSPRIHVASVPGVNHLALRTSPEVYRVFRRYFSV